jgi:hypothetical protein
MYSPSRVSALTPPAYQRAPMIFRLQLVALNAAPVWHVPLHFAGTGPYPLSWKLLDSGHMPVTYAEIHYLSVIYIYFFT